MRYAVTQNGSVLNIIEADANFTLPGFTLVEATNETVIGGTYEHGVFYPPVPPDVPLEILRAQKLADLATQRYAVETGGIVVNNAPVRTDRETASILTAAFVTAVADPNYVISDWKVSNGVFIALDASMIIAIATAVRAHIQFCFSREAALTTAILAAPNKAALDAIDIAEGWTPS